MSIAHHEIVEAFGYATERGSTALDKTITLEKTDEALMCLGLKKLSQHDWNNMLKLHRFHSPMDRDRVLSVNLDDFFFIVGHQQQVLTDQYTANARSKVKKACQVFDPYNTGRVDVEQFRNILMKDDAGLKTPFTRENIDVLLDVAGARDRNEVDYLRVIDEILPLR